MPKDKIYKLPYWVENGGDGSANVRFCSTLENAEKKCEGQSEKGEGWGEPSANTIELKVKNGKLFFLINRYDESKKTFIDIWIEVKE
jgi:hypothetical protein